MMRAMIFNIQRYSVEDGPGIRTTVFFKGCPLHCLFCSNPESQNDLPEVGHNNALCTKCGRCLDVCSLQAISLDNNGVAIDRYKCNACGECVSVCRDGALKIYGREMSLGEVLDEVSRDSLYYRNSGGGVTVSGGEPLLQASFAGELLKRCQQIGFSTAVDTCGYVKLMEKEKAVLNHSDLMLFDLKHMKSAVHREITSVSNELILSNAKAIAAMRIPLIIRVPLVPTINDSEDNIRATAAFAASLPSVVEVDLLPYHRFGVSKYEMPDRTYRLGELESPSAQHMEKLKEIVETFGLKCKCGG